MNYKKKMHTAIALMIVLALLLTGCAAGLAAFGGDESEADNSSTLQDEQTVNPEEMNQSPVNPDETSITSSSNEDNENQEPTQPSEITAIMETYKSVLQGNTEFFSTDANKNLNISQLTQAISSAEVTVDVTNFAVIDIGHGGTPAVILSLNVNGNGYGVEVLSYQDGIVYGYTFSGRQFGDLRTDGTFVSSGGASDVGICTITFDKNTYSIDKYTFCESNTDSENNTSESYFVNHKSATEDEYNAAFSQWQKIRYVTWYDFTEENIEAQVCVDLNTDPLTDTADNQKSYYGEWSVQKVLACGIGTYSSDEAEKLVGKSLTFSADEASIFTDQPSDAMAIIDGPEYQETTESRDDFQADYRMRFDTLGISTDSVTEVQVTGPDGVSGAFLIKDSNTIILIAGGTYFELVKQ